ncbi:threonine aldolase family protein [Ottowia thiooxydans]|uniref:Threonine aldolase n=1 Tax=Ottowia thiooxydans TaxID=219182 RepID=A0ABV2Q229_9BURK
MIDLRSDTVTLPTERMYEQMCTAPLGDDGLGRDPTALKLEQHAAALLDKQAGLYVPSATMGNLLAILAQAGRQQTVIAGTGSHILTSEQGAAALTGCFFQSIPDARGALCVTALAASLHPSDDPFRPSLVCAETSHNNEGGAVAPLGHMQEVYRLAHAAGARVHLDGARLFNAALALGTSAASICAQADTVSVCLSKGLSAPMGAVLVGPKEFIDRARFLRKALGGTQRQVGISAAAGLVALSPEQIDRLSEDHAMARRLAHGFNASSHLSANTPQTNIVQVNVARTGMTAIEWVSKLRDRGVWVREWGPHLLRCVTHRHLDAESIDRATAEFLSIEAELEAA